MAQREGPRALPPRPPLSAVRSPHRCQLPSVDPNQRLPHSLNGAQCPRRHLKDARCRLQSQLLSAAQNLYQRPSRSGVQLRLRDPNAIRCRLRHHRLSAAQNLHRRRTENDRLHPHRIRMGSSGRNPIPVKALIPGPSRPFASRRPHPVKTKRRASAGTWVRS